MCSKTAGRGSCFAHRHRRKCVAVDSARAMAFQSMVVHFWSVTALPGGKLAELTLEDAELEELALDAKELEELALDANELEELGLDAKELELGLDGEELERRLDAKELAELAPKGTDVELEGTELELALRAEEAGSSMGRAPSAEEELSFRCCSSMAKRMGRLCVAFLITCSE